MGHIGIQIKQRREELGMTQEELAKKLGYKSKSTINKIEAGINDIVQSKVIAFAEALDTTPAYLMGWSSKEEIMSIPNIIPLPTTKKVPLIGKIACGDPITAVENIEDYIDMPDDVHADFALTCQGDSMINARIVDGDIVYIRQQPEVENGEIAAVLIDGEATLKRVYYQKGKIILQPENPAYAPLIFEKDEILDVRILGKAIYFLSKVRS